MTFGFGEFILIKNVDDLLGNSISITTAATTTTTATLASLSIQQKMETYVTITRTIIFLIIRQQVGWQVVIYSLISLLQV